MAADGVIPESPAPASGPPTGALVGTGAGFLTMVALCFANGLQGGVGTTFQQSTEALKHAFHINDAVLGIVPFGVSIAGNVGALLVATLCARRARTRVLAGMFVVWGVLVALAGLAPASLFGASVLGFAVFATFRISAASMEATDPAALPLIADWWPVEQRARKVSIFNSLSAVGGILGLVVTGVLVDHGLWRVGFVLWLPFALLGAVLIKRQREPDRGAQDAAYRDRLEAATSGAEHEAVERLVESDLPEMATIVAVEVAGGWRSTLRAVARLRSWRVVALGLAISGLMGNGFMTWGLAYFKRTFGLSSTQASGLAPVLGAGAFAGVFFGGFLADRLLARGVLRARLYVTAFGFAGAGVFLMLAFTTTRLAIAAPLLGIGSALMTLPTGPQFALMMDVTPAHLRSQASAALNVVLASGALGSLLVGVLSASFHDNLRLALFWMSPLFVLGAVVVYSARTTYVEDVALVVAEARAAGNLSPP